VIPTPKLSRSKSIRHQIHTFNAFQDSGVTSNAPLQVTAALEDLASYIKPSIRCVLVWPLQLSPCDGKGRHQQST